MSSSANDDLPPVEDGCGLLPHVPRELVSAVAVSRIMEDAAGVSAAFALPRRFTVDDDEVSVADYCGGGMFRAQAKDSKGRFLKGYPPRTFFVEGAPRDPATNSPAGDVEPPPPPAPPPPAPPAAFASLGVPIASPLPGMPSVSLDLPGLSPEMRAFLGPFAAMQAYGYHATMGAVQIAINAAREGANAERESACRTIDVAKHYLDTVTAPRQKADGEALRLLGEQITSLRADLSSERTEHAATRALWHAAEVERATLRTVLETGGQMPAKDSPGWLGFVERMASMLVARIGPQAAGLVAAQMGIGSEEFRALTAAASSSDSPPGGSSRTAG